MPIGISLMPIGYIFLSEKTKTLFTVYLLSIDNSIFFNGYLSLRIAEYYMNICLSDKVKNVQCHQWNNLTGKKKKFLKVKLNFFFSDYNLLFRHPGVMHHFVIMPHFVIPAPLCNKTCPTL